MRRRIALILATACLTVAGCGTDTGDTDTADTDTSSPDAGSTVQAPAGETPGAFDFTGTTLEGETFEGASLAGKPAVLWFWAPWCPTCRSQIPTVTKLGEQYQGAVAMVAVGGLAAEDQIVEMAESIPHVTHLIDQQGTVWNHFDVTAQSTFEVIDANGKIVSSGYLDLDELKRLVAGLAG